MDMQESPFVFTVIMAVYKVLPYIREAIDSLIGQDFGFDRVQLILVDDGSPDGCGAVCDEYAARYPENVTVVHKENGGVSSARNAGLPLVRGKYVNFMDPDDLLTPNVLSLVCAFLEAHAETDVASIPVHFFEGREGDHFLNYKFEDGTRVIDLREEWTAAQLQVASAFIRREALSELRFDTQLTTAEDAKLMLQLLLNKPLLGVVDGCSYRYRRRGNTGEPSLVQGQSTTPNWYLPCLRNFHEELIRRSLDRFGCVPKYIQYALIYELQWRIRKGCIPPGVLTPEEERAYLDKLRELLRSIDDDVILAVRDLWTEYKYAFLRLKHGPLQLRGEADDIALVSYDARLEREHIAAQLSSRPICVDFLELKRDRCRLEGHINLFDELTGDLSVFCAERDPHDVLKPLADAPLILEKPILSLGEPWMNHFRFRLDVPLSSARRYSELRLGMRLGESSLLFKRISFTMFAPIAEQLTASYYRAEGWCVRCREPYLLLTMDSPLKRLYRALRFDEQLLKKDNPARRKAAWIRPLVGLLRALRRRPLWLVMDRVDQAGDNGEAFFRFMRREHPEIDCRFVLSPDSCDAAALRKIGKLVTPMSDRHKRLFLQCDYVISSHLNEPVFNPLLDERIAYRDILTKVRFICLQHGITKDDQSNLFQRSKRNIFGLVAAARPEYEAFLQPGYQYTEKEIWLTGFPRFDRLYRSEREPRLITVMPTWRKYLVGSRDPLTGSWGSSPAFFTSEFYSFYRGLLNHPRLLEAVRRHGYQLALKPHPNMLAYISDFLVDPGVELLGSEVPYRDVYADSDLIVTDYSSAVFDFAYLRRPVLYAQFDQERFFSGEHSYTPGYYDYERDGLGEVTRDLESTVDRIIEYMENGCEMKPLYRERAERFFAFSDQENCRRVYEKILERAGEK